MKRHGKHRKHWWTPVARRAIVMIAEMYDEYFFDLITRDRRAHGWAESVPAVVS